MPQISESYVGIAKDLWPKHQARSTCERSNLRRKTTNESHQNPSPYGKTTTTTNANKQTNVVFSRI